MRLAALLLLASAFGQDLPDPGPPPSIPSGTMASVVMSSTTLQDGAGNLLNGVVWINGAHAPVVNGVMSLPVSSKSYGTLNIDTAAGVLLFSIPGVGVSVDGWSWDSYIQPSVVTTSGTGIPFWPCVDFAEYNNTKTGLHYACIGNQWLVD